MQIKDYLSGKIKTAPLIPALKIDAPEPWQILAITFTNKAAGELKERLVNFLGQDGNDIWAGTFHSICMRILRANAELAGYKREFTIYDTDDSKKSVGAAMKELNIDEKALPIKTVMNYISRAKDKLLTPDMCVTMQNVKTMILKQLLNANQNEQSYMIVLINLISKYFVYYTPICL